MAHHTHTFRITLLAWACASASHVAWAQDAAPKPGEPAPPPSSAAKPASSNTVSNSPPAPTAQKITVTGQMIAAPLDVGGFGDAPLSRTPIAASVIGESRLRDAGARSLSDLTRLDAGVSAAYDADGYIASLSARGYTVDNRYNQRRDGLPINGETVIGLANKRGIELLKGASGMQAGTSAPGGLVNYLVKRPTTRVRQATLELRERGGVSAGVDVSERFGREDAWGLRVNAEQQRLRPAVRDADGTRRLLALAGDWRARPSTLVELEVERSHQSQPSVPGFSLLGNTVPAASSIDPRLNLNNQPWTLPVVFDGTASSLRVTHTLANDWRLVAHGMTQNLSNQDRVAFPYGVYDATTYECAAYCDRYAPDGSFTLWEFQSDNERRRSSALDLRAEGRATTGSVVHRLSAGVLSTRHRARFQQQIFDIAGQANITGTVVVPRSPGTLDENTNRNERSTELYLRDAIELSPTWTLWTGLRHTRLQRESVRTDGSRPTDYDQSFTTPWLAASWRLSRENFAYASWGQGIESDVAPNRSRYTNAGQALPALRSRQAEFGFKHDGKHVDASVALFDIQRPQAVDVGACDGAVGSCTRTIDGNTRHRGVEALLSWHDSGPLTLHASGMLLSAKRSGSQDASQNGLKPVNVPRHTLRLYTDYDLRALLPTLPGLAVQAGVVHEGERMALPDNTASIPAWTRVDLSARWRQSMAGGTLLTWRVGIDNVANTRAWKEAPYQFGHAYLFPLAPRTVRFSLVAAL